MSETRSGQNINKTPPPLAEGGRGKGAAPSEPLRQFLQAARSAGIRVSAAEGIDAARAVQVVGFSDRLEPSLVGQPSFANVVENSKRQEPDE